VFLIRKDGELDIEIDRHLGGIFAIETWHEILRGVGFNIRQTVYDDPLEDGVPIQVLICNRPG
jgi:hypothetical protein